MGERRNLLMLSLIVLLGVSMMNIGLVAAPAVPTFSVDPSSNTANPGETFTISIYISGADDMYAWEFKIAWNPELLEASSVTEGAFLKTGGFQTYFTKTDLGQANLQGWMLVGALRIGTVPGRTGNGYAAYITFQVEEVYSTGLDLYDSNWMDSNLDRYWAKDGWVTEVDGSFDNTAIVGTWMNAELVRKSAWPEHHHFNIPKDEDFNTTVPYCSFNTLYGKVRNTGLNPVYLMVGFTDVPDILTPGDLYSNPTATRIDPGVIVDMTADFGPLGAAELGKYAVSAAAYFSYGGIYWYSGPIQEKSFSFAVVWPKL